MLIITRRNDEEFQLSAGSHRLTCVVHTPGEAFPELDEISLEFLTADVNWTVTLARWQTLNLRLGGQHVAIQYVNGAEMIRLAIEAPLAVQITRPDSIQHPTPPPRLTDADRLAIARQENQALRRQLAGCQCSTAYAHCAPGDAA